MSWWPSLISTVKTSFIGCSHPNTLQPLLFESVGRMEKHLLQSNQTFWNGDGHTGRKLQKHMIAQGYHYRFFEGTVALYALDSFLHVGTIDRFQYLLTKAAFACFDHGSFETDAVKKDDVATGIHCLSVYHTWLHVSVYFPISTPSTGIPETMYCKSHSGDAGANNPVIGTKHWPYCNLNPTWCFLLLSHCCWHEESFPRHLGWSDIILAW